MSARRPIGLVALLAPAVILTVAAGGEAPIPWPHGDPPSSIALQEMVGGAVELADRERLEEYLEAFEKGEDSEHIFVLQPQIDLGTYDLDALFRFGDAFFAHEFRGEDGYGDKPYPALQRVHAGVRGGLDTYSCAGCHSVGGPDGAGGPTQNAFLLGDGDRASSANQRNAPHVLGLGFVQALGAEMTYQLGQTRSAALAEAAEKGIDVTAALESKGVSFGSLTAHPDGSLDTSAVVGVDRDLVIKPFGWKGDIARLRRFAEDAARIHFGIQSHVLALGWQTEPDVPKLGPGPNWWDPDNDGVQREIEEGILTATAVYMSMLETPVILPPHDPALRTRWSNGMAVFEEAGCASCHRPELPIAHVLWDEWPDTTGGPPVEVNLVRDGDQPRSTSLVRLYSDLKRHDMGEALADPHDGAGDIPRSVFLTRPLWGLAETAPYLHDGRAATIPEAIEAHGGEATASRDAFRALDPEDRKDLHVFLLSLTREPKVHVLP
ncbi:di-heme oxidoredictase family protein [Polyangium sp. 6x1]|uniref:di-heme oxidoredictase family protein n=1 Tax=Polyangium sp. 6x1 TaxID=3042689 RepID=UPI002482DF3D|nr:di-heme oxidoredictase family protein [Polyangium sp. 6x1]MDI1443900.1 di-heme oxidoredictase family protein [Polyangium sp. 6x1]